MLVTSTKTNTAKRLLKRVEFAFIKLILVIDLRNEPDVVSVTDGGAVDPECFWMVAKGFI